MSASVRSHGGRRLDKAPTSERHTDGCRTHGSATSEAVTNAVRHAYPVGVAGDIRLAAATDGEWLTVRIEDRGSGAERSTTRGLGLPLMTALCDRMEFTPGNHGVGTIVLMEFPMVTPAARADRGSLPSIIAREAVQHLL